MIRIPEIATGKLQPASVQDFEWKFTKICDVGRRKDDVSEREARPASPLSDGEWMIPKRVNFWNA